MKQFEVKQWCPTTCWYIGRGTEDYMHRDGEIVHNAVEYWLTCEQAQAVLDKYQPHVWKHGDVFDQGLGDKMMYLAPNSFNKESRVVYLEQKMEAASRPENYLERATFLFNIKDKL